MYVCVSMYDRRTYKSVNAEVPADGGVHMGIR